MSKSIQHKRQQPAKQAVVSLRGQIVSLLTFYLKGEWGGAYAWHRDSEVANWLIFGSPMG
jgi:hypothetical protein